MWAGLLTLMLLTTGTAGQTPTPIPPVPTSRIVGGLATVGLLLGVIWCYTVRCREHNDASLIKLKQSHDTSPGGPADMETGNTNVQTADRRVRHVYNPTLLLQPWRQATPEYKTPHLLSSGS
ncbi:uncharacterized protein LOC144924787 [Branchiostoma floridae x Branchiostoma belcheri]